jgi:hypothetical protein
MNRLSLCLIPSFLWFPLIAQELTVDIVNSHTLISSAHLDPPYTAGADYSSNITLDSKAVVSLINIEANTPWCLSAHQAQVPVGGAAFKIGIDYSTISPDQWSPVLSDEIILSTAPVAVFSGIGEVEQLEIKMFLENAQIGEDWELRNELLIWTVTSGGCTR